jgi:hypothetical protein
MDIPGSMGKMIQWRSYCPADDTKPVFPYIRRGSYRFTFSTLSSVWTSEVMESQVHFHFRIMGDESPDIAFMESKCLVWLLTWT